MSEVTPSLLPYRLYDPHLRRDSQLSRGIRLPSTKKGARRSRETRGGTRRGVAIVDGELPSAMTTESERERERETNAKTVAKSVARRLRWRKGGEEARDCCARICNSRSICKRQRNLNRGDARNGCLGLVGARFAPASCTSGIKIIRSLEDSLFILRRHLRCRLPRRGGNRI